MPLRIYADFNSRMEDERGIWCWSLRHEGRPLDEVADELGLYDGMAVVIFYEDEGEEFEYEATLGHSADQHWKGMWMACYDETSFRRLR